MQSSLKPEEDYLNEDKPLRHLVKKQNFCVLSMLTPNSFPESKREQYKDQKILGIMFRGVFETYEDAKKRCEEIQKNDKFHNIFIGEVGKWLPFNVDIATMETEDDPVYREKALNQYMKAYKDALKEEEIEEKERKEQTLKANNAKIVTGTIDAPKATGIGCPEITPPGVIPQSMSDNVEKSSTEQDDSNNNLKSSSEQKNENIDEQIKNSEENKLKIEEELQNSKNNLKELEEKLSAINHIYADLKK